ncbi:MAG: xylose isomerase [Coprobacillaceae bacterium]
MSYFKIGNIKYDGPMSIDPFAFKEYNKNEVVAGKTMAEHLKFAMSYWHTFNAMGDDPFGGPTMDREWDHTDSIIARAKERVYASFEFMEKLGLDYFCFHDVDILPEFGTISEYQNALAEIVDLIESEMKRTEIKLLWGTTNAFGHERFVHGASKSCNPEVFAYTAARVKFAMDITKRLGGLGYVFWGGREGYETLLNTEMKFELDNLGRMLTLARDYAREINFEGELLIEPKPMEPTKHQYDYDAHTVIGFLRGHNLENDYKLNLEVNHATLAGHTMHHEMVIARENGMLGSLDANYGDLMLGWDTDQFPTNIYDAVLTMSEVLKNDGIPVGINFDAKVRRASFEDEDLFIAYIAGMDTFAKGLKVAAKLLEDGVLENFKEEKYSGFKGELGKKILDNKINLSELAEYINQCDGQISSNSSGRQEYLEAIVNQYIYNTK